MNSTSATSTSPNVQQAVPFFMITDMERSVNFYVHQLGFEIKMKWVSEGRIEWCWLQLGGAALMLQQYRNSVPAEKRGVGVSIAFICDDALAIYTAVIARGVTPEEPFVGNNMWVVAIKDPDDYQLFFESMTDVPEGTSYADWTKTH